MKQLLLGVVEQTLYVLQVLCGRHPSERCIHMESTAHRIEETLGCDTCLQSVCDQSPKVFELPFKGSETARFVIIWLHFRDDLLNHQDLYDAIQASIRGPHEKSLLRDYEGIEVVPYTGANVAGEGRVVRVSVQKQALAQALTLQRSDFMGQERPGYAGWHATPIDGVLVSWYRNPDNIPAFKENR